MKFKIILLLVSIFAICNGIETVGPPSTKKPFVLFTKEYKKAAATGGPSGGEKRQGRVFSNEFDALTGGTSNAKKQQRLLYLSNAIDKQVKKDAAATTK